ncbi:MAG: LysM peptidoglycan-binding domain-containing protein, partial [SAR324 cluster bacterium]|nr:LysM peptidoglycan-binding domain-containing protein [SAR324 cluster bacterium]
TLRQAAPDAPLAPVGLRAGAPAKPFSTISNNDPAVLPFILIASQKTTTMVKSAEKVITLVSAKSMPENAEASIRTRMLRHRVRKGESLKLISKKYYGNSHRWREIYRTNGHRIKRPNLIFPGQIILVPMAAKRDLKANRLLEEILNYRDTSRHPIFQKEARRRAG